MTKTRAHIDYGCKCPKCENNRRVNAYIERLESFAFDHVSGESCPPGFDPDKNCPSTDEKYVSCKTCWEQHLEKNDLFCTP